MSSSKTSWSREHLEAQGLVSRKTNAVYDPEFTRALKSIPWSEWMSESPPFQCLDQYKDRFHHWVHSTSLNSVKGLERFPHRDLINGTTQAFDEHFHRYSQRRLRFFRGEYAYHRRVMTNWKFLEDGPLLESDSIILSWPFCSTGDTPSLLQETLDRALEQKVPVLIDCAYFGTCQGLDFDFSHPAIHAVCFSLSKGLGLGSIRSGLRYSIYEDDFPIRQQNRFHHSVLSAAQIGLFMMERFSPDYIPGKYRQIQLDVCRDAGLSATPCMHLALAGEQWEDYRIDDRYHRVGIRELIKARRKAHL